MTCITESYQPDDCCYTDRMAQDAVGSILINSVTIAWTYTPGVSISAAVISVGPDALPDEASAGFNIKLWEACL